MSNSSIIPKISVVMPSFNTVDYIERAIRSVVEQDYPKIELFIKDGGSNDGTLDIIKYYAEKFPKIIKWVSSKDEGQTDAINIGLKNVSGDILAYLNSDDVYKKDAFKKIGKFFAETPQIMWTYGKCDIIDGDDREIRKWITGYKNFWLQSFSYTTLLILNYISQMGVFFRKEAFKEVGDFDKSQHYVMDYDYWLRLGEKYRPGIINEYLGSFRIVPTTKSSTGFIKQFRDEYEVSKKHTKNKMTLFLHYLHYQLVIIIYSILKFLNSLFS